MIDLEWIESLKNGGGADDCVRSRIEITEASVDKIVSSLCSEEESLTSTFGDQQKEGFERYRKYQDELNRITEFTAFADGF